MSTVILETVARTVVPLIVVTAIALLLQGHNLPGGGFIAGVLTAVAFVLLYVTYGTWFIEEEVLGRRVEGVVEHLQHGIVEYYRAMFAVGLLVAAGSGVVAMAFGWPFLTQTFWIFHHVPLFGEFEIASALAFDLGVYFVVVGALLTIVSAVGEE
jgi:multicomponent Na+:H+ antiporter subunit B